MKIKINQVITTTGKVKIIPKDKTKTKPKKIKF